MAAPSTSGSRGPTRTLLFALGACVLALALAWIAGEALVRGLGLMDRINVHPRRLYTAIDDPRRPYGLRPAQQGLVVLGESVRTNALGLRGAAIDGDRAREATRILVLGDSVVFGWRLAEEETFALQLEGELRARGRESRVLNAGTPGYNSESELAALETLAPAVMPDLVILGVSLNDFSATPHLSPQGYMTTRKSDEGVGWLDRHSELYVLWRWFLGSGGFSRVFAQTSDANDPDKLERFLEKQAIAQREKFYAAPDAAARDRIVASLRGLRELAKTRGFALGVVIFPERDQVVGQRVKGELDARPQARWRAWCEAERLRCLDLLPAFVSNGRGGALFVDLQHPSGAGIGVSAAATADALESFETQ